MDIKSLIDRSTAFAIEPMFQSDGQGRELFFPFGFGSRGRVVPSAAIGASLRGKLRWMWLAFFAIMFVASAAMLSSLSNIWGVLAFIAVLTALIFLFTCAIGNGLAVTEQRMNLSNNTKSMIEKNSLGRLVKLSVVSIGMTAVSTLALLLPSSKPQSQAAMALGVLFFGVCTLRWIYLAIRKWQNG